MIVMHDQMALSKKGSERSGVTSAGSRSKGQPHRVPFAVIATFLTVVLIVGGVVLGVTLAGLHMHADASTSPLVTAAFLDGVVEFSGGAYYRGTDRVNPTTAMPVIDSKHGDFDILGWWIRPIDCEGILFEGNCANPESALATLRSIGELGEYKLYFKLTERTGAVHIIGGNFFIKDLFINGAGEYQESEQESLQTLQ